MSKPGMVLAASASACLLYFTWRVENSHRKDLTRLPDNFRKCELEELLPPGERQVTRCNTQPFILDGDDGGHTEFSGDEYLIGYWMGRYLKEID